MTTTTNFAAPGGTASATTSPMPGNPAPMTHAPGIAGPYQLRLPQILIAVGIVLQSVDTLLAKTAFDVIVNESELVSLLIAVAVAGIGALAAVKAGIALKERIWLEVGLIGGAWALIGVSMALLRFNTGLLNGLDENLPADMVVALLMLVLYLAAGGGIISATAKVWDPRHRALRSSRRGMKRVSRTLDTVEPQYARVVLALAHLDERRADLDDQVRLAQDLIATEADQLRARARLRIAEHLGDPAKTSLYRQPAWTGQDEPQDAATC